MFSWVCLESPRIHCTVLRVHIRPYWATRNYYSSIDLHLGTANCFHVVSMHESTQPNKRKESVWFFFVFICLHAHSPFPSFFLLSLPVWPGSAMSPEQSAKRHLVKSDPTPLGFKGIMLSHYSTGCQSTICHLSFQASNIPGSSCLVCCHRLVLRWQAQWLPGMLERISVHY